MKLKALSFALALAFFTANGLFAQGDFFFSFSEGGPNEDQAMNFDLGDSGSLYLYWSTNGPADSDLSVGAFVDIFTTSSGVIQFTSAETFDFGINIAGTPIGNRWLDENGGGGSVGPAESVAADFINELSAFTVTGGPGILEANAGNPFLDEGYNADNDGFLFGRIDFDVIGVGTTAVTGAAGEGQIVNGDTVVDATFTTATISVSKIPEPSAVALLSLGLTVLVARRRR